MKNAKKMTSAEIAWTVIEGILGVAGIVFIVLGFVAHYLPLLYSDNYLLQSEQSLMQATGGFMTYRWLGFLLLLAGAILALITLNHFAKKSDLTEEKEIRRQQRLKIISESAPEEVVDAPAEPAEQ